VRTWIEEAGCRGPRRAIDRPSARRIPPSIRDPPSARTGPRFVAAGHSPQPATGSFASASSRTISLRNTHAARSRRRCAFQPAPECFGEGALSRVCIRCPAMLARAIALGGPGTPGATRDAARRSSRGLRADRRGGQRRS